MLWKLFEDVTVPNSREIDDLVATINLTTPQDIHSFGAEPMQAINDWVARHLNGGVLDIFNLKAVAPRVPGIDYDALAAESLILQSRMNVGRPLALKLKPDFISLN
jgi:hypothetical protein